MKFYRWNLRGILLNWNSSTYLYLYCILCRRIYYYPLHNLQLLNIVFNLVMYMYNMYIYVYVYASDTYISHKNDWYPCLVGFFFFFGTDTTKSSSSAKSSLLFLVCTVYRHACRRETAIFVTPSSHTNL